MMRNAFIDEIVPILERTPATLDAMLRGMPAVWIEATDGPGTWSAFDVMGHLVQNELANWLPRLHHILREGESRPFEAFDREAQFNNSIGKSMDDLLDEFGSLRMNNIAALLELDLNDSQLERTGIHPALGVVTARQLLATAAAHDMAHILQISRTMARHYREEVGPWAQFLSVMK